MDTSCLFAPLHCLLNEVIQTRNKPVLKSYAHQANIHQYHHITCGLFQFAAFVQIYRGYGFGGSKSLSAAATLWATSLNSMKLKKWGSIRPVESDCVLQS